MGARECFAEVQRGKIVGYKYDEPLLNLWLGEWGWHMSQAKNSQGYGKKVPGMEDSPDAACPEYENVRYEREDADRSAVITVIVYEELPLGQRLAVEHTYLASVYRLRDLPDQLRQGKEALAKALIRRGYPL